MELLCASDRCYRLVVELWATTTQMVRRQALLLFSTVALLPAFEIVPAFEFVDLTRLAGSRIVQPDLIAAATPRPEEQSASSLWRAWSTLRSSLWSSAVNEGGEVDSAAVRTMSYIAQELDRRLDERGRINLDFTIGRSAGADPAAEAAMAEMTADDEQQRRRQGEEGDK